MRPVLFFHRVWYRALSLRYVRAMHVVNILTPRLPLCQVSFLSRPPIAELARGEKSRTHSLAHSITQFNWFAGNRSFGFGIKRKVISQIASTPEDLKVQRSIRNILGNVMCVNSLLPAIWIQTLQEFSVGCDKVVEAQLHCFVTRLIWRHLNFLLGLVSAWFC